jgi:hypothetical protein
MSKIDLNGVIRDMTTEEEENYFGEKVEEHNENDVDDVQAQ